MEGMSFLMHFACHHMQDMFDLVYGLSRITPAPPPTPVTGARPRYLTMALYAVDAAQVGGCVRFASTFVVAAAPSCCVLQRMDPCQCNIFSLQSCSPLQQGRRVRPERRGPWLSSRPLPAAAAWRLDDTPVQVGGWVGGGVGGWSCGSASLRCVQHPTSTANRVLPPPMTAWLCFCICRAQLLRRVECLGWAKGCREWGSAAHLDLAIRGRRTQLVV
jgi:hypothetical protein